jgi:CBS domain-containing protein
MIVADVMTRGVECIDPENSLVEAARKMKKLDIGIVPVCGDDEKLVGMLTDRDIVVRALADDRDIHETKVRDIMTPHVVSCQQDQPVEHAAHLMREHQIRRLVVLEQNKRLIGIVSLGDLAADTDDEQLAGSALEGISQPADRRR